MRKLVIGMALLLTLGVAACGASNSNAGSSSTDPSSDTGFPTAYINTNGFKPQALTAKVGQPIIISDPAATGDFVTVLAGQNGTFQAQDGMPSDLNAAQGKQFQPSQLGSFTFTQAGTYYLTIPSKPNGQLKIVVK